MDWHVDTGLDLLKCWEYFGRIKWMWKDIARVTATCVEY